MSGPNDEICSQCGADNACCSVRIICHYGSKYDTRIYRGEICDKCLAALSPNMVETSYVPGRPNFDGDISTEEL